MKNLFIWMLFLACALPGWSQNASEFEGDEKSIMEVVEKETLSFFMGEYLDWTSCWEQSDDIYFEWVRSNVHHFYTSWDELSQIMRPVVTENVSKKDMFYAIRSDVRIYRDGDLAWVSYQQDLSGDKSNEQRLLRKTNGSWKIIMVTVVASETFPKFQVTE